MNHAQYWSMGDAETGPWSGKLWVRRSKAHQSSPVTSGFWAMPKNSFCIAILSCQAMSPIFSGDMACFLWVLSEYRVHLKNSEGGSAEARALALGFLPRSYPVDHIARSLSLEEGASAIFPIQKHYRLVVLRLPLWKIWLRKLGWWHSQYMGPTSYTCTTHVRRSRRKWSRGRNLLLRTKSSHGTKSMFKSFGILTNCCLCSSQAGVYHEVILHDLAPAKHINKWSKSFQI